MGDVGHGNRENKVLLVEGYCIIPTRLGGVEIEIVIFGA